MQDDVIAHIRQRYETLTPSQKRIAECIVDDPDAVAFGSAHKLAERLGVSPSTIVRFAYRIDLGGYKDLQDRVRHVVRSHPSTRGPTDVQPGRMTHLGASVYAISLEQDLDNLLGTISGLAVEDMDRAVSILVDARRVFVTGAAGQASAASYAAFVLDRTRGDSYLLGDDAVSAAPLLSITDGDALLAISFPPYTRKSLKVTSWARSQGARVVAVTDSALTPVGQHADVLLRAVVSGQSNRTSLVAPMAVINALLNGVIARSPAALDRDARITALLDDWAAFS